MNIESRFKEEKKVRLRKELYNRLGLMVTVFGVWWLVVLGLMFFDQVNASANQISAVCPVVDQEGRECGSIPERPVFEKGTHEWWNQYCNDMLGTKFECK